MRHWWHGRVSPEAKNAVEISKKHLDESKARWRKVNEVTDRADQLMRRNHLAESIAHALSERR